LRRIQWRKFEWQIQRERRRQPLSHARQQQKQQPKLNHKKRQPLKSKPTREEIERLAKTYWEARGRVDGYAEQDWARAEKELLKAASTKTAS